MLELGLLVVGAVLLLGVVLALFGIRSGMRLKKGGRPKVSDVSHRSLPPS